LKTYHTKNLRKGKIYAKIIGNFISLRICLRRFSDGFGSNENRAARHQTADFEKRFEGRFRSG